MREVEAISIESLNPHPLAGQIFRPASKDGTLT
jgi:hypothetical protein